MTFLIFPLISFSYTNKPSKPTGGDDLLEDQPPNQTHSLTHTHAFTIIITTTTIRMRACTPSINREALPATTPVSSEGGLTGVSLALVHSDAKGEGGGIGAMLTVPAGGIKSGGSLRLRRVEMQEMQEVDDMDFAQRGIKSAVVQLQAEGPLELQKPAMVRWCLQTLPTSLLRLLLLLLQLLLLLLLFNSVRILTCL